MYHTSAKLTLGRRIWGTKSSKGAPKRLRKTKKSGHFFWRQQKFCRMVNMVNVTPLHTTHPSVIHNVYEALGFWNLINDSIKKLKNPLNLRYILFEYLLCPYRFIKRAHPYGTRTRPYKYWDLTSLSVSTPNLYLTPMEF